jgi:hypothetical protein
MQKFAEPPPPPAALEAQVPPSPLACARVCFAGMPAALGRKTSGCATAMREGPAAEAGSAGADGCARQDVRGDGDRLGVRAALVCAAVRRPAPGGPPHLASVRPTRGRTARREGRPPAAQSAAGMGELPQSTSSTPSVVAEALRLSPAIAAGDLRSIRELVQARPQPLCAGAASSARHRRLGLRAAARTHARTRRCLRGTGSDARTRRAETASACTRGRRKRARSAQAWRP